MSVLGIGGHWLSVLLEANLSRSFWSCFVQSEQGRIEKLDKTLFLAKVG